MPALLGALREWRSGGWAAQPRLRLPGRESTELLSGKQLALKKVCFRQLEEVLRSSLWVWNDGVAGDAESTTYLRTHLEDISAHWHLR